MKIGDIKENDLIIDSRSDTIILITQIKRVQQQQLSGHYSWWYSIHGIEDDQLPVTFTGYGWTRVDILRLLSRQKNV